MKKKKKIHLLSGYPQKKGLCSAIKTVSPKKPSSARRKVGLIKIYSLKTYVWCYLPGEKQNLQQYGSVLVRGGRTKDLPGVKYKCIRGKYDFPPGVLRCVARSKYGTKKWKFKPKVIY